MGAVFFLTLTPIILIILAFVVVMAVAGIAILVISIAGGVASASAMNDGRTKTVSLIFFGSLFLLGMSCVAVLGGIFSEAGFFIPAMLTVVGAAVASLGVVGVVKSFGIEAKAGKIALAILLSISTIIGSVVYTIGLLLLL